MALAVVTGSSSGIGLATAVALARARTHGRHDYASTSMLAREIRKISANENLPIYPTMLNVDHDDSVRGGGAVEETPLDVFRQVMETNFSGGLLLHQDGNHEHARTSPGEQLSTSLPSRAASR